MVAVTLGLSAFLKIHFTLSTYPSNVLSHIYSISFISKFDVIFIIAVALTITVCAVIFHLNGYIKGNA